MCPVYSVDTEEEARDLLVLACALNGRGEFIAEELVMEQTLENVDAFGDRLHKAYAVLKRDPGPVRDARGRFLPR